MGQWLKSLLLRQDELAHLRKFPLLRDFSNWELYLFSQLIQERTFKAGEYIYKEDFPLTVVYLILKGEIEVVDHYEHNSTPLVLRKHQFLGIIDMYNEDHRKGNAKAIRDSILLAVSKQDLQDFWANNPKAGVKFLNSLSRSLSHYIYQLHTHTEAGK
jgi:CRP-like cAMP-binding protein